MNFKELVNEVSVDTSVVASDVRKVVKSTLSKLSELIDQEEKFISSDLVMSVQVWPEISGVDGKQDRPVTKIGRLKKRKANV